MHVGFNRGVSVTEFVNTAIFTGVPLMSTVFAVSVRTNGGISNIPSTQLSCLSTQNAAVHVAANCGSVFVNGSETVGARKAGIEFSLGTFRAHLNVTVWAPMLPIALTSRLTTLNPVSGWTWRNTANQCVQMYQRSTVDAFANFTEGTATRILARVTSLVESLLTSSNAAVATLSGTSIVGNGTGSATITAQRGGRTLGSLPIIVGNPSTDNVSTSTLQVFVATALSMSPMNSPFAGGVNSDAVTIVNQLELEDAAAGVATFVP